MATSLHKVLFVLSCKGVSQRPQWIDHCVFDKSDKRVAPSFLITYFLLHDCVFYTASDINNLHFYWVLFDIFKVILTTIPL